VADFPVDPDGHEQGPAADDTVFADLLVAGVEDEIGTLGFGALAGEALQFGVEVADGFDFPGGGTLDKHCDEGGHEGLFAALVAAEDLGVETALAVLRDAQLQGAHPGDPLARVVGRCGSRGGRGCVRPCRIPSASFISASKNSRTASCIHGRNRQVGTKPVLDCERHRLGRGCG
jgi:hypothetical protein